MKKLINLTLAMLLVFSTSAVVFADNTDKDVTPSSTVSEIKDAANTDVIKEQVTVPNKQVKKSDVTKEAKLENKQVKKEEKAESKQLLDEQKAQMKLIKQERLQLRSKILSLKQELLSLKEEIKAPISDQTKQFVQESKDKLQAINTDLKALQAKIKDTKALIKDTRKEKDLETRKALMEDLIQYHTEINAKIAEKADVLQGLIDQLSSTEE